MNSTSTFPDTDISHLDCQPVCATCPADAEWWIAGHGCRDWLWCRGCLREFQEIIAEHRTLRCRKCKWSSGDGNAILGTVKAL